MTLFDFDTPRTAVDGAGRGRSLDRDRDCGADDRAPIVDAPTADRQLPGATVAAGDGVEVLERVDGIDLVGEVEASGYRRAPSLARRSDGQMVQLTPLLYQALECIDGRRSVDDVAAALAARSGKPVTADNVRYLVDKKLRPAGLLKAADGSQPEVRRSDPLLALKLRVDLVDGERTRRLTAPFAALFHPVVAVVVVAAFTVATVWLLGWHGLGQGTRQLLYSPGLLVAVFLLTVASAAFHEFGHAAGCQRSGGRPGAMGAGIYLVWPAFYTDVTDAYRLDRRGRLRTDVGGLYFNAIVVVTTFAVWLVVRNDAILLVIPLQLVEMLHQLVPMVRLDGYHILADVCGVPDLFARIKPTRLSLVPGRQTDDGAKALKPWVRAVVCTWVLTVIPALWLSTLLLAVNLPRILATAWDSAGLQWQGLTQAWSAGEALGVAAGGLGLITLVLSFAGTAYLLTRLSRRILRGIWEHSDRLRGGRPALIAVAAVAAVTLAALWWPNGEYRPIQEGERGTITDAVGDLAHLTSGRPSLTPERAAELGGAPFRRAEVPPTTPDSSPSPSPSPSPTATPAPTPTTSSDRADDEGDGPATSTTQPRTSSTVAPSTTAAGRTTTTAPGTTTTVAPSTTDASSTRP